MNRQTKCWATAVALTAGVTLGASAKTVCFLPLTDGASGETVTSVSTTLGTKTYIGIGGKADGPGGATGMLPVFTNAVPGKYLYATTTNETPFVSSYQTALGWPNPANKNLIVGSGPNRRTGQGCSHIRLDGLWSDLLKSEDGFTIEFFACYFTDMNTTGNNWDGPRPILVMKGDGAAQTSDIRFCMPSRTNYEFSWQLDGDPVTDGTGTVKFSNFLTPDNMNGCVSVFTTPGGAPKMQAPLADGMWHHYALVYKAGEMSVYRDYRFSDKRTVSIAEVAADAALVFGGSDVNQNYGIYGFFGALRTSDCPLTPTDFMVASDQAARCQPGSVVFHYSAEVDERFMLDGKWGLPVLANRVAPNDFAQSAQAFLSATADYAVPTAEADPVHSDKPWVSVGSQRLWKSFSCGKLFGTAVPKSTNNCFRVGGKAIANPKSFTLESFVKLNALPLVNDNGNRGSALFGKALNSGSSATLAATAVFFATKAGALRVQAIDSAKTRVVNEVTAETIMDDLGWHHLAIVYDDVAHEISYYCDYKLLFEPTVLANGLMHEDEGVYYFGGNMNSTSGTDASFDEIRLTAAALDPTKFLKFCGNPGLIMILR